MGLLPFFVIPAKAGIQERCRSLDSGFRRNDGDAAFSDRLLEPVYLEKAAAGTSSRNASIASLASPRFGMPFRRTTAA
jgi:hypothetical protein